ncbi:MAG: MerR family transcriptional regulator [Eubacterium sp.]
MNIHEVEILLNISKSSIRYYDRIGLLAPARKENGYRDFTEEDLHRLRSIIVLRNAMFPLKTIADILNGDLDLQSALLLHESELDNEMDQIRNAKMLCSSISADIQNGLQFKAEHYLKPGNSISNIDSSWTFCDSVKEMYELHPFGLPMPPSGNQTASVFKQLTLLILIRAVIYTVILGTAAGIFLGAIIPVVYFIIAGCLLTRSKHKECFRLNNFISRYLSEIGLLFCVIL